MKKCRITLSIILAIAMTVTMMPWLGGATDNVYAEPNTVTVCGEDITVDVTDYAKESALNAFKHVDDDSSAVTVESSGNTLTIKLTENVVVNKPIRFVSGNDGKKVLLDLNGYTISGRAGVKSSDPDTSIGGDAIWIKAYKFNVEIKGPGSVIGGKGASYINPDNSNTIEASVGGDAIFFVGDDPTYNPAELEYGLKISGGAIISGGDGSDSEYADWETFITNSSDDEIIIPSGQGGNGISQDYFFISDSYISYIAEATQVYAKIEIENGTVKGGKGGIFDAKNHPFTIKSLYNNELVQEYVSRRYGYTNYENGFDNMFRRILLRPGNGGDGVQLFTGRKYVYVGSGSTVSGGDGGQLKYGSDGDLVNRLRNIWSNYENRGDGGNGIKVCGDTGLTNANPTLSESNWGSQTKDSGAVGIWIDGTVNGGNSASTKARQHYTQYGGNGILIDGADKYSGQGEDAAYYDTYDSDWGMIVVGASGKVFGGDAGDSVWGEGGKGGDGIRENRHNSSWTPFVNNFIIRGSVEGGKGGDSLAGQKDTVRSFRLPPTAAEPGEPGCGGNGLHFSVKNDTVVNIMGNGQGSIKSGRGGTTSRREGSIASDEASAIEGLEGTHSIVSGDIVKTSGGAGQIVNSSDSNLKAAATMTWFDQYPSNSTRLNASVTLPSGYKGNVYYDWRITFYTNNIGYDNQGDRYEYDFGDSASFTLADSMYDAATIKDLGSLVGNNGNKKTTIYCYVMLEDGRYVKSNEIWFKNDFDRTKSPTGWTDGGGGGSQDDPDAMQTALDAINAINNIPTDIDAITLEHMGIIHAARVLFDMVSAFSDEQKDQYFEPGQLANMESKLIAAENKIAGIVADIIRDLPTSITEDNVEEAEGKVEEAYGLYICLTERQKEIIQDDEDNLLDKLDAVKVTINQVNQGVANRVMGMIDNLNDSMSALDPDSLDYETAVLALRDDIVQATEAYENLTDSQMDLVGDDYADKLQSVIEKYNEVDSENPIDDPTAHVFGEPTYKWAANNSTCTATATDQNNPNYIEEETVITKAEVTKNATCTAKGTTRYTATFNNDLFETQTKVVENIPALGHSWRDGSTPAGMFQPGTTFKQCTRCGTKTSVSYNYDGTAPSYVKKLKVSKGKKAFTVKWKKQSKKNQKLFNGYQIRYSTNADMSGAQYVKASKKSKSKKIKRLAKKTVYYVQVRTYTVKNGETYYSGWSNKTVKTK